MKNSSPLTSFALGIVLTFLTGLAWVRSNPVVETRTETRSIPMVGNVVRDSLKATPNPVCRHTRLDRDDVLLELNEYRLEKGLPMLASSLDLKEYAQLRAEEMSQKGEISHDTKYGDLNHWLVKQGKPQASNAGEAINMGYKTACESLDGFKGSPTHNAGITDPKAGQIGIGVSGSIVVLELGAL